MKSYISVVALALLASMPGVIAHIDMQDPPPIRHKNNPNTKNPDTDYTAPIKQLCKGYQNLGGDELKAVATWQAGSQQKFTLGGSAVHGGGSCQASISEDGGKTFKAIKSYIGNCPLPTGNAGTFDFTVPKETKNGDVLFAWSWFNKIGNREMYMNCASITITGGGSGLSSYPDILVANIGNGCTTVDNKDILIPNPGKDVDRKSDDAAAPIGNCGTSAPVDTPPVDTPPVETPVDTPPVDTPPVDTPPVDTPPVDTPPVETPVETPPVDTPPVETPVETPPVETPVDEAPVDDEEPVEDEQPVNDEEPVEDEEPVDDEEPYTPPTTKPPTNGGSCTEGEIICDSETTFSLCSNGTPISMGKTASGTKCTGGKIVKRAPIRFSSAHMAARKL